jgi:hypothetical protein
MITGRYKYTEEEGGIWRTLPISPIRMRKMLKILRDKRNWVRTGGKPHWPFDHAPLTRIDIGYLSFPSGICDYYVEHGGDDHGPMGFLLAHSIKFPDGRIWDSHFRGFRPKKPITIKKVKKMSGTVLQMLYIHDACDLPLREGDAFRVERVTPTAFGVGGIERIEARRAGSNETVQGLLNEVALIDSLLDEIDKANGNEQPLGNTRTERIRMAAMTSQVEGIKPDWVGLRHRWLMGLKERAAVDVLLDEANIPADEPTADRVKLLVKRLKDINATLDECEIAGGDAPHGCVHQMDRIRALAGRFTTREKIEAEVKTMLWQFFRWSGDQTAEQPVQRGSVKFQYKDAGNRPGYVTDSREKHPDL